MNFRLEEIADHVAGELDRSETTRVRGYSIDSRSIKQGELFFAVRGPNFDGHDFVREAAGRGASGAVVAAGFRGGDDLPLIRVGSPPDALGSLARAVRRAWGGPLVAVTGSIGKTTTKEMISTVLGERRMVLRSVGNMNNEYGLPLCLLRAEKYHDFAVLEMGMSATGEIQKLAAIAEPNEGVITNVNPVHLEFFKSIGEIAQTKAELLEGLTGGERRAYLNNDDSRVRAMSRRFDGEIVTYGVRSVAAFRVTRIENLGLEGTDFTVRHGRREVNFVLPMLGAHNVSNVVAAISVGVTHGISWDEARLAVEKMAPEKMRGTVVNFREGFALIDDSYNSSPKALTEMTKLLGQFSGFGRKILVAGEMLELGATSGKLHAACGKEAVKAGIELIVGVGDGARALVDGAAEAGADPAGLLFARDSIEAGDLLTQTLRKGDLVLLKGSRGVHLEQVLDTLRLSFSSLEP